jgi:hypothetical protein
VFVGVMQDGARRLEVRLGKRGRTDANATRAHVTQRGRNTTMGRFNPSHLLYARSKSRAHPQLVSCRRRILESFTV